MKKLSFVLLLVLVFLRCSVKCDKSFIDDEFRSFVKRGNERSHRIQSVQKHRDKRGLGTFLIILHGISSAAFDIYKYERGCEDWAGYRANLNRLDYLRNRLKELKDEINLAWVPLLEKQRYFDRIISSVSTLEGQLKFYLNTQEEIMLKYDPDINTKLNATIEDLKARIDADNMSEIASFDHLTAQFMSDLQYTYRLISNLQPLASWAIPKLANKIGSMFASRSAGEFVKANPGRIDKLITYAANKKAAISGWFTEKKNQLTALLNGFKTGLQTKFQNYMARHSRLNRVWTRVANSRIAQLNWGKIRQRVTATAKFSFYAAFVGYDIYLAVEFVKECDRRKANSDRLVANLTAQETEMLQMKEEIRELINHTDGNYTIVKNDLSSDEFKAFIESIEDLYNETSNADLQSAINNMKYFVDNIDFADQATTDTLLQNLINDVTAANRELECIYDKARILRQSIDNCLTGKSDLYKIFQVAVTANNNLKTTGCKNLADFEESDFNATIENFAKTENKSTNCVLNNPDVIALMCRKHLDGTTNSALAQEYKSTLQETEEIVSNCKIDVVDKYTKDVVCIRKQNSKTLAEVIYEFNKFDVDKITEVYKECQLSESQKGNVCTKKNSGFDLNYIHNLYKLYSLQLIQEVYDACILVINKAGQQAICVFKKFGVTVENPNAVTLPLIKTYGEAAVRKVYDSC